MNTNVFSLYPTLVKLNKSIEKTIIRPIHHAVQQIHIPKMMKAIFYLSLGIGIVILDQLYATKILAEDQAEFYNIVFRGKKYWITQVALLWGGIFFGLGTLYAIDLILSGINKLLDRSVRVSIIVHR